jgi:hypothetical protein
MTHYTTVMGDLHTIHADWSQGKYFDFGMEVSETFLFVSQPEGFVAECKGDDCPGVFIQ